MESLNPKLQDIRPVAARRCQDQVLAGRMGSVIETKPPEAFNVSAYGLQVRVWRKESHYGSPDPNNHSLSSYGRGCRSRTRTQAARGAGPPSNYEDATQARYW